MERNGSRRVDIITVYRYNKNAAFTEGTNVPVEIILIGGAAVIENYGFREMTTDIDAILPAVSIMKDAINHAGDRFGLPN